MSDLTKKRKIDELTEEALQEDQREFPDWWEKFAPGDGRRELAEETFRRAVFRGLLTFGSIELLKRSGSAGGK